MAGETNPGVTNMERVEVTPAGDDEEVIQSEETDLDSPQENEGDSEGEEVDPDNDPADESPDGKPENIRPATTVKTPSNNGGKPAPANEPTDQNGLRRLPDETAREFALRLELHKTRGLLREQRGGEIVGAVRPGIPAQPKTLSAEQQKVLEKYNPKELDALREVMPALAAEMGFVRKDEMEGSTYAEKAQAEMDTFFEKHPEYLPENDPDGTLWQAFKTEFGDYNQPKNPKDLRRIFEKAHQSVFGIQPSGALPKNNAAQRKVEVASHASASKPAATPRREGVSRGSSGLRLDALKGFSDEEKESIASRANG